MIAKEQKEALVLQDGEVEESVSMSLDENSTQLLMKMLSKNLYSDPIGSTVRETASNALDSHRRAGVKEPIIVGLKPDENGNWEYSVEDFGTGLDSDDVKNIISKYGKSTKRESANELGMFGLGFKSPLAYCSSFYFVCRKDGIERKYMMYEGEVINSIDLLYEVETEKKNGVKVIVPILSGEVSVFVDKIQQQLAYFEDVWFDVHNVYGPAIANDFKIIRETDWQYSELTLDRQLHLCLDNVYYPLDLRALGINASLYFPIALRFNLSDGLYPIPNREAIRITEEVKPIILAKLKAVAQYMISMYNITVTAVETFDQIVAFHNNEKKLITLGRDYFNVGEFEKVFKEEDGIKLATPKLEGIEKLNLKRVIKNRNKFFFNYVKTHQLKSGSIIKDSSNLSYDDVISKRNNIFTCEETIPSLFKEYIRSEFHGNVIFVKKKKNTLQLRDKKAYEEVSYYSICGLKHHPKSEWRQIIKEYQSIIESHTSKFTEACLENIPQTWKEDRDVRLKEQREERRKEREAARKKTMHGDMYVRKGCRLERRFGDKKCKFETDKIIIDDIPTMKGLIVYDIYDNENRLNHLYDFRKPNLLHMIFSVSKREAKKLAGLKYHNLLTYDEFMKGDTKAFSRVATACLIQKIIDDNYNIFHSYGANIIKNISIDLYSKIEKLKVYNTKYSITSSSSGNPARIIIAEFAEANGLYDDSIYPIYKEMNDLLSSIKLDTLLSGCGWSTKKYDEAITATLVEVFKYRKIKVNLCYYSKPAPAPAPIPTPAPIVTDVVEEEDLLIEEDLELELEELEELEQLGVNPDQLEEGV